MRQITQEYNSVGIIRNTSVIVPATLVILIGQIASMSDSSGLLLIDLGIVGIIALFLTEDNLFPFMLCLVAPNRILTYGPISAPTIIMLVGLFRNIKAACKFEKPFFISVFGLFGMSIFTGFLGDSMIFDAIKIIVVLRFLRIYTDCNNIQQSYICYVKYCAIGCLISGGISLIINPDSISDAGRFSLSQSGENVLGILCAILVVHFIAIAINGYFEKKGYLFIYSFALIGIGFLTGSRSFFLALAIGFLFLLFTIFLKFDLKSLARMLLICLIGVILCYSLVSSSSFISDYLSKILYRVNKLQGTDISNGRFTLWTQYINVLNDYPAHLLFGGLNPSDYGIENVAHNMIIEQVVSYGIIGSIFVISAYNCMLKCLQRESHSTIKILSVNSVPLIALLGAIMVSHTLLGVPQTIMLYFGVIGLYVHENVEVSR